MVWKRKIEALKIFMSKKTSIQLHDYVNIINPEVVVRWGYTLNKQIVKDEIITEQQKNDILTMLRSFDIITKDEKEWMMLNYNPKDNPIYEKVLDAISYGILKLKGFGGNERKLFVEKKESLRNKRGIICQRKVVKTGTYSPGGSCQDYYTGEYDYEPAYLSNEITHVLYRIRVSLDVGVCQNINDNGGIWIEKENVKKILC